MSVHARGYQAQITGRADEVYLLNGVSFDGLVSGALVEAKGPGYVNFMKGGHFRRWFQGKDGLLAQAEIQLTAARGAPLVWHVAEEDVAERIRVLLADKGFHAITVVHTPVR